MNNTEPIATIPKIKSTVNRILPTHELSARQRRKKAVRLNPETKPEAPRSNPASTELSEDFFSQFPPQAPLL